MSERVILHSDLNNYFASVECLSNPGLKALPLAVCGDAEARCGVILAKNEVAKSYGIRTGDTVFAARKKCKDLILCATHFDKYVAYSKKVRQIYERFTDQVESFSIDECFLDVTESAFLFGSGEEIAERIRRAVKEELSLTVSVGVSFNKVFAKIASDMKKPDAVTVIDRENYREKLWPLPVRDMLYVGASTERTLEKLGIRTIGQLARYPEEPLVSRLGKWGH
ncbi:MAG: DNA polymerase IV, partial [Christensenellaceae bacterium]